MNPGNRVGLLLALCALAALGAHLYQTRTDTGFSSRMVLMAMLRRDGSPTEDAALFNPEATVLEIAHHTLVEKRIPLFLENLRVAVRDSLPETTDATSDPLPAALTRLGLEPETFVRMMDLPQMARVLGVAPPHAKPRGLHAMTDGPARNRYADALRALLLPEDPSADLTTIRAAAHAAILRDLSGSGTLREPELMREVRAVPHLRRCGLYTVVGDPDGEDARWWTEQIKRGLRVERFEEYLLPVTCSLHAVDPERGIPQMLLHVLAAMIEADYFARAHGAMHEIRTALEREIDAARQSLRVLEQNGQEAQTRVETVADQLRLLDQMAGAVRQGRALPPGWDARLPDERILQELAERIRALRAAVESVEAERVARLAEAKTLRTYIDDPARQTIRVEVTRIVREDSDLLRSLREQKREKEMERAALLQRATPSHPLVRSLQREIERLDGLITLHDVPAAPVTETEERTNPKLTAWRRDLSDLMGRIDGLDARRTSLVQQALVHIGEMRTLLEGESESIRQRQIAGIRERIRVKERQVAALEERATVGAGVEAAFEVYTQPLPASVTRQPSTAVVYGVALGGACLLGLLLILLMGGTETGRRQHGTFAMGSHGAQADPDMPGRLPVLAKIHAFE